MTSKESKAVKQDELDSEPSLDQMVDLNDPKTLQGLGRIAAKLRSSKEDPHGVPRQHL